MSESFAYCEIGNKKVILTGYEGFIGSNFLSGRNYSIKNDLDLSKIDVCIHLACLVSENDFEAFQNNVGYDSKIFSLCRENKIKLIYVSTNNVYPLTENCNEDTPYAHFDFYSLSKITSELILKSDSSLNYVILRLADVFGRNQRHGNLFHAIQKSIETSSPLKLFGAGSKLRSYIYIKELIKIFEYFIENDKNGIFNVAYPAPMSVKDILGEISRFSGLKIENVEYNGIENKRTMSVAKLENSGYKFKYTLKTALENYVNEIRN